MGNLGMLKEVPNVGSWLEGVENDAHVIYFEWNQNTTLLLSSDKWNTSEFAINQEYVFHDVNW